jgi:hypothetical protein
MQEIKNGCALPPEEIQPINPFPDIPFQSYPEDLRFELMREGMLSWLKNEVEKEVGIEVVTALGMDPYFHSDNDNWYCVGSVLMPKLSEDILWNMRSRFEEDWGKWDVLVYLVYWGKDGLVIYEYEPKNTPAP